MDAWTEIYREEKNNLYFEMLLLYSQFLKRFVLFMNLGYNIQKSGKPVSIQLIYSFFNCIKIKS